MGTVVFDLDGTLADTSADLIAAANAALVALGHSAQLLPGRDDAVAFRGGRAMLALGIARLGIGGTAAETAVDAGHPILLEAYEAAIDVHTRPYPGAVEAIGRLRGTGYRIAICTNKPVGLAEVLLARLGIRDLFDALVGAGSLPVRKPDPAPLRAAVAAAGGNLARALLVGDTDTDRKTARAAGTPCILVGFGPSGSEVAALAPEAVIENYDALDAAVDRLIGRPGN